MLNSVFDVTRLIAKVCVCAELECIKTIFIYFSDLLKIIYFTKYGYAIAK